MKLSIIIPVFNEERTIERVLKNVTAIRLLDVEKEIIIVDDGSTDTTSEKLKALASRSGQREMEKSVLIFHHKENLGKGAAVRTGIEKASGEYILIQDADLEYNPEYIKKLILPVINGDAKVVYGTRLNRLPNLSRDERTLLFLLHFFGNRFLSLLTSILYGQWLTDIETGYKLFSKKALQNISLKARSFDFEPEITAKLLKNGYKILEVNIKTIPRGYEEGKKLHTVRDGIIALWTLIKFRFIN